jgi:hypothetical protein
MRVRREKPPFCWGWEGEGEDERKGVTRPTPECILRACTTSYELEGYGRQRQSRLQSSNLTWRSKWKSVQKGGGARRCGAVGGKGSEGCHDAKVISKLLTCNWKARPFGGEDM